MLAIGVTQRVVDGPLERRDALDQRWVSFLHACGFLPIPIPNAIHTARAMIENLAVQGFLFTGGNTLAAYGGDAPERDEVETMLLSHAIRASRPALGVCRGMQLIQHALGVRLRRVEGHVSPQQSLVFDGALRVVNSYHTWGTEETVPGLTVLAQAPDGVVKAVRHSELPLLGVMWHPERISPFSVEDIHLFREFYEIR